MGKRKTAAAIVLGLAVLMPASVSSGETRHQQKDTSSQTTTSRRPDGEVLRSAKGCEKSRNAAENVACDTLPGEGRNPAATQTLQERFDRSPGPIK